MKNVHTISIVETKEMKLSEIKINEGQIEGLPRNPRIIKDKSYEKLKQSIEELPEMLSLRELLVFPYLTEEGTEKYCIIGGNMRYRAMKDLGYKTAPCKVLAPNTSIQVLRAILLRDNSSYGEWDLNELANNFDLPELDAADIDLPPIEETGNLDEEAEEDNYNVDNNIPEQPKSKLGDIYVLGNHRLICGDSTKQEFIDALTRGEQVDCIITDPPYNVNYEGSNGLKIENDQMEDHAFLSFLVSAFKTGNEALKPGGAFYIWHADSEGYNFRRACKEIGWKIRETLIWVKNSIVLGRQDYQWRHEPCLYGWKDGAGHYFINRRDLATIIDESQNMDLDAMSKSDMKELLKTMLNPDAVPTTTIYENKPLKNDVHPTMKPLKLIGRQIRNSTRPGEAILDLFGGSGSTMMAAEQLNRKCYMVEFDPKYVDVIVNRWEQLTGSSAVYQGNILEGTNVK